MSEITMDVESELFKQPVETLAKRFRILFKTKELSDCSFALGEKKEKIVAHRIFLAITSPVFYSMFFGKLVEASEISIPDLTPSGFTGMLKYIYTDTIEFDCVQNAVDVLMAAKKYIVPLLEKKCLDYIRMNTTAKNCVELFELAKELTYKSLEDQCLDIIRKKTTEVIGDEGFLEATESTVRILVGQDSLSVTSEFELFKRVEDWMVAEGKRRGVALEELAKSLRDIVKNLRFLTMTAEEFALRPAKSDLLSVAEKFLLLKWCTLHEDGEFPEGLSSVTHTRSADNSRASGTLTFAVELSLLCGMTPGEKIYSQPSTIADVPWKIKIEASKGSRGELVSAFSVCTKDGGKNIKRPSSARMRLLDSEGVELIFDGEPDYEGWQELEDTCHDEENNLCLEFPFSLDFISSKWVKRLQLEVEIKNV